MNRTIKIRLPDNETLRDTCKEYSKVANQMAEVGFYLGDSRFDLHRIVYKPVRATSTLSAQLVISCIAKTFEALKKAETKPRFKESLGVRYDARSYWVDLREGICSLTTIRGRKKYAFTLPNYYLKYVDWEVCGGELVQDHKNRMWLHVVVSREAMSNTCSTGAVHNLGVDLGVNNLAVTSDGRFYRGVTNRLDKIQRLRRMLQAKGTKSAKRHLKRISRRQRFMMRDINHRVAKEIVESIPTGSVIVLEDLKGIRKAKRGRRLNRLLSRWSFDQFRQFLTYKAEERGIRVVSVKAKNTSKTCSRCGSLDTLRPKQGGFLHCNSCGYGVNADYNGAKNILARLNPTGNERMAAVNRPIVAPLLV